MEKGTEKGTIDRIRGATFSLSRRGYDKREVDTYLARLADWLERGGGEQVQADTVKNELERVGRRTSKILTAAEEAGQGLRADAEREAREVVEVARTQADSNRAAAEEAAREAQGKAEAYAAKSRQEVEAYSAKIRQEADAYATKGREEADAYSVRIRSEADSEVSEKVREAETKAVRMVEEGAKRRAEIEKVVADLQSRRNSVLRGLEKLSSQLAGAATDVESEPPSPQATVSDVPEPALQPQPEPVSRPEPPSPGEAASDAEPPSDAQSQSESQPPPGVTPPAPRQ